MLIKLYLRGHFDTRGTGVAKAVCRSLNIPLQQDFEHKVSNYCTSSFIMKPVSLSLFPKSLYE